MKKKVFRTVDSRGCCCCCCGCCCSHINSHNQVRGHRTGSSYSGAEGYPKGKTLTKQRWCTYISQLTQFMPPTKAHKSEIGSKPTMCQVHTVAYISLLAPGKPTIPLATQDYHVYITRCTYHYAHTHVRRKSIGKKKQREEKKRKEKKRK